MKGIRWLSIGPSCLALYLSVSQASAQIPSSSNQSSGASDLRSISALGRSLGGWHFYAASAAFGYSSLGLSTNSNLSPLALERIQSDFDTTGSMALGYNRTGPRSGLTFFYAPSYVQRFRFSDIKAFNQSTSVNWNWRFLPRWDLAISAQAADTTLDQVLFTPAVLMVATNPTGTLDDLIAASQSGLYQGDQLASILTGTPYVVTPSRSVAYGSPYFTASASSSFRYRSSPRLSFTFTTSASRSQTRTDDSRTDLSGQANSLIPRNTTQQISAGVSYALAPRTQLGIQTDLSHVSSTFTSYSIYTTSATINRKLTPRWFVNIRGGGGYVSGMNLASSISSPAAVMGPSYLVQADTGYTATSQSWMASYSKSIGDTSGFGSRSSESLTASWQWKRGHSSWSVQGGGGVQRLEDGVLGNITYWQSNATVTRTMNRQFMLGFTFAYLLWPESLFRQANSMRTGGLSGYTARMTLIWTPSGSSR